MDIIIVTSHHRVIIYWHKQVLYIDIKKYCIGRNCTYEAKINNYCLLVSLWYHSCSRCLPALGVGVGLMPRTLTRGSLLLIIHHLLMFDNNLNPSVPTSTMVEHCSQFSACEIGVGVGVVNSILRIARRVGSTWDFCAMTRVMFILRDQSGIEDVKE